MKIVASGSVRTSASDEDLMPRSRAFADRKVARLLDDASRPAFVAAMEAFSSCTCAPDRVALFTVSDWEPRVPPVEVDGEVDAERLAQHYQVAGNPTDWLRGMPNNALCQIAIAGGFRGPNIHLVGSGGQVGLALTMARRSLLQRESDSALVVAFEIVGDDPNPSPDAARTRAAALALSTLEDATQAVVLDDVFAGFSTGSAVQAVDAVISALDSGGGAEAITELVYPSGRQWSCDGAAGFPIHRGSV